ncbi:DUF4337 domain-containing protein [Thiomonas bhubaneswarensis]|uniref:DUF4337 domain-containing protein n=1 Tax=Thiomonas bhubaneswarensis TaxID=339866 RepID=A0A0K6I9K8_9BURK|nr:DUF4337 domain-containing protein [Thiomonas bhubaneswarensis]CUA99806.1 Domain of unknown function (DUF4337) [Thiomonas bhubaneswarensis]
MSESGIHTHAPHEEFVEEQAAHHPLSQWVAIFTALLAALGAIVSYQGSHLMNEVLLHKNEAVLQKAHATDQWNYYEAVSTKEHLMELARDLAPPERQAAISAKIQKYDQQKISIKRQAEALEQASLKADNESDRLNRPHTELARSLIFLQIAISLASITALTGRRWLFALAFASAAGGVGLWLMALVRMGM